MGSDVLRPGEELGADILQAWWYVGVTLGDGLVDMSAGCAWAIGAGKFRAETSPCRPPFDRSDTPASWSGRR